MAELINWKQFTIAKRVTESILHDKYMYIFFIIKHMWPLYDVTNWQEAVRLQLTSSSDQAGDE